ncbi:MAG: NUDIX hydrolase [Candidatus Sumerlaeaceae bacterium]
MLRIGGVNLFDILWHYERVQNHEAEISSAGSAAMADYNDPNELLAIVNEHDEECGSASRRLIHELGLFHRAVHVLVFLPGGELVIQRRSKNKDTYPLHWECVGGHVAVGENYEVAALREVEEELGVSARDLKFVVKLNASPATGQEFICVYRAQVSPPLRPNSDEIAEWRSVRPQELCEMIALGAERFSPVFLETLKATGFFSQRPQ